MNQFSPSDIKKLYIAPKDSHKGENGKLTIIGGSKLFHGASLWSLRVASRIVDMVFYASTSENNEIAMRLKSELFDFIAVPRDRLDEYIEESDVVLIGPGLPREEGREDGEESTKAITERLLKAHPNNKWVLDAGALTEMDPEWLTWLRGNVVITPHEREFESLQFKIQNSKFKIAMQKAKLEEQTGLFAKEFNCIVLLKRPVDIICSPNDCVGVAGGNVGMTKGGTGDVLAGLVAALCCNNDMFLAAKAAAYIHKKTAESLSELVGPYYNATDLADEIPKVMKKLLSW